MWVMDDTYRGRLTTEQRKDIDAWLDKEASVRRIAAEESIAYGRVRGYVDWKNSQRLTVAPPPETGPAVLIYDIETAPALAWMWSAWKANIIAIEQDWYVLSFAYKWLGQDDVYFVSIVDDNSFQPDSTNDKNVVSALAKLFDYADVVVAHNGDQFDRRKANARFLYWKIDPPSPYQTIDTRKASSREFANYSNSLKELGRLHGLGEKTPHQGFDLWRSCMRGDEKAWQLMKKYNKQDVVLLEKLYLLLLPWIGQPGKPGHPNLGFWNPGETTCPKCGSTNLQKRGIHRTTVSEFQTFQCKECKGYSRARHRNSQQGDKGVALL